MFLLALPVVLFQWPLVPQPFLFCWAWMGVPFLSSSVSFFHQSIWKTTFMCRNSHKLLIGRDEFMIESCSIIIRQSGGQSKPERLQLCITWTNTLSCISLAVLLFTFFYNVFRRANLFLWMHVLRHVFFSEWCVSASFQGALAEECNRNFSRLGLALFSLSLKNLIYCPLTICNSQFAAFFLCHSTVVDFSSSASPSTPSSQCVSLIGAVGEFNSAESLTEDGWSDWRSVKVRESDWVWVGWSGFH